MKDRSYHVPRMNMLLNSMCDHDIIRTAASVRVVLPIIGRYGRRRPCVRMGPKRIVCAAFRHHDMIFVASSQIPGIHLDDTPFPVSAGCSVASESPHPTTHAFGGIPIVGKNVARGCMRPHHLPAQTEAGIEITHEGLETHEGRSGEGKGEFDFLPDEDSPRHESCIWSRFEEINIVIADQGEGEDWRSDIEGSDDADLSLTGHLKTPYKINGHGEHKEFGNGIESSDNLPSEVLDTTPFTSLKAPAGPEGVRKLTGFGQ